MTWLKVDDGIDIHPKVRRIPRRDRGSAMGLWLMAGAWSARNLTDGHVPAWVVDDVGSSTKWAHALVTAGLWEPHHADGWVFHDWADYQPTKEKVLSNREKRAVAGRSGGRASGQSRRSNREATAKQSASPVVRESFDTDEPPYPARTRPVPSLLTYVSRLAGGNARSNDAACLPQELIDQWQEVAGPGADLEHEAAAYLAHYADRPADDERAAWLGWLRKSRELAARDAAPRRCRNPRCVDGWLGEDEESGRPIRCPDCRPGLAKVIQISESAS